MTSVYTDADYLAVYKQKKKIFGIFWAVTAIYVIFCIAWWISYMGLPYADPMQKLPKFAAGSIVPVQECYRCDIGRKKLFFCASIPIRIYFII